MLSPAKAKKAGSDDADVPSFSAKPANQTLVFSEEMVRKFKTTEAKWGKPDPEDDVPEQDERDSAAGGWGGSGTHAEDESGVRQPEFPKADVDVRGDAADSIAAPADEAIEPGFENIELDSPTVATQLPDGHPLLSDPAFGMDTPGAEDATTVVPAGLIEEPKRPISNAETAVSGYDPILPPKSSLPPVNSGPARTSTAPLGLESQPASPPAPKPEAAAGPSLAKAAEPAAVAVPGKPPAPAEPSTNAAKGKKPSSRKTQIIEKPALEEVPRWVREAREKRAGAAPSGVAATGEVPATDMHRAQAATEVSRPGTAPAGASAASPQPTEEPAASNNETASALVGLSAGVGALLLLATVVLPRSVQGALVAPWTDVLHVYGASISALVLFLVVLAGATLSMSERARGILLTVAGAGGIAAAILALREANHRLVFHGHPLVAGLSGVDVAVTAVMLAAIIVPTAGAYALGRKSRSPVGLALMVVGLAGWGVLLGGVLNEGGALFSPIVEAIGASTTPMGDRIALIGGAVGFAGLLLGLIGGVAGTKRLATIGGAMATVALASALMLVAAFVSASLFEILEPVKLMAILAAVVVWLPASIAALAHPK